MIISDVITVLRTILAVYQNRGVKVLLITEDNDFKPLRTNPNFLAFNITLNRTSEDYYELHIERFNRTLRESCRMTFADASFLTLPRRMVIEIAYGQVLWYNFVIPADYISETLGPGSIILGRKYE